jgi:predicted transcriptional regulator
MRKILLSINPEHVSNILNGTKKYEFRKVRCKEPISEILIYSTSSVMKVVASASVKNVLDSSPEALWAVTHEWAGIEKEFYDRYYRDSNRAIAYELGKITIFEEPRPLEEYGILHAPQSFAYI